MLTVFWWLHKIATVRFASLYAMTYKWAVGLGLALGLILARKKPDTFSATVSPLSSMSSATGSSFCSVSEALYVRNT